MITHGKRAGMTDCLPVNANGVPTGTGCIFLSNFDISEVLNVKVQKCGVN
jgi:hypothetical protein